MAPYSLHLDSNNAATLVEILKQDEERFKAIAALSHTTEAERIVLIGKAAVVQTAYFQIEGILPYRSSDGAPDWDVEAPKVLLKDRVDTVLEDLDGVVREIHLLLDGSPDDRPVIPMKTL